MKTYYKVTFRGSSCLFDTLTEARDEMATLLKEGAAEKECEIKAHEYTKEQVEAMPEFAGW